MLTTSLLLSLVAPAVDDEVKFEAKVWREPTFLVLRLYAKGGVVATTTAFRTPILTTIEADGRQLEQRRGDIDFPESVREGEEEIRVSAQIALPTKDDLTAIDLVEGTVPMLCGGELHETRIADFRRYKKKKRLSIPALKEEGAGLSIWFSRRQAVVFRVVGGVDQVHELTTEGPFVQRFGTSGKDPFLAVFPDGKKLPADMVLVVRMKAGGEVRLQKIKVGRKTASLDDPRLEESGVGITVGYEPRDVLHLISHGDDRCIRTLELETEEGPLEGEHARTVPGLTESEDQWIYPSIPDDAFLRLVVRSGAEWAQVPFSLRGIRIGK